MQGIGNKQLLALLNDVQLVTSLLNLDLCLKAIPIEQDFLDRLYWFLINQSLMRQLSLEFSLTQLVELKLNMLELVCDSMPKLEVLKLSFKRIVQRPDELEAFTDSLSKRSSLTGLQLNFGYCYLNDSNFTSLSKVLSSNQGLKWIDLQL